MYAFLQYLWVCIWRVVVQQKCDCKQLQLQQHYTTSVSIYVKSHGGSRELSRLNGRTVMQSYSI